MFRNLLVSIVFFIGPALLMFIARNLVMMGLAGLKNRKLHEQQEAKVIDITPIHNHRHPNWYVIAVVIISMTCAVTVFLELQRSVDVAPHEYVPAYTDEAGNIVPSEWKPKQPETSP